MCSFVGLIGEGEFHGVMYVSCKFSKPLWNRISSDIVSGNIIWVNESYILFGDLLQTTLRMLSQWGKLERDTCKQHGTRAGGEEK